MSDVRIWPRLEGKDAHSWSVDETRMTDAMFEVGRVGTLFQGFNRDLFEANYSPRAKAQSALSYCYAYVDP